VKVKYVADIDHTYLERFVEEFNVKNSVKGLILSKIDIAYNDPG